MTPPLPVLGEAARYASSPAPTSPLSDRMCAAMVPALLDQRERLARALLAAYPTFSAPRHQRAPMDGAA